MGKNERNGGAELPATQEQFDRLLEGYMDRGEKEAVFDLLEKYPEFMRHYAEKLEEEWGL